MRIFRFMEIFNTNKLKQLQGNYEAVDGKATLCLCAESLCPMSERRTIFTFAEKIYFCLVLLMDFSLYLVMLLRNEQLCATSNLDSRRTSMTELPYIWTCFFFLFSHSKAITLMTRFIYINHPPTGMQNFPTHMCVYHGLRNTSFSANFTYVLNGWFLLFGKSSHTRHADGLTVVSLN